ncbi:MAG: hypothetical protein GC157_10205 [Frankiales bacterium]|nr:hypothetical protein [Frankiales bacterium]
MSHRITHSPGVRLTAAAAGIGAVASTLGGLVLAQAPVADAAINPVSPPADTDPNNDWGQTAAQVQEEINLAVDADPGVIAARTRYLHALASYATLKHAQKVALDAARKAKATPSKLDDARTLKAYQAVSAKVYAAAREVVASQLAMVKTVDAVTARVKAQHYVQAPYVALPAAPTGLQTVGATGQVTLTWAAVDGATGYRVYRDGVQIALTVSTTYLDTGLDNGVAYSYQVLATNVAGWSPQSAAVTGTPTALAPAAPSSLVTSPGDGTATLAWQASAAATSYTVYRDGVAVGTVTDATFLDTGLVDGTTYLYTVVALNGTAASSPSAAVPCTPVATAPDAPTNLVASPGDRQVSLTWTASAGATSYGVYRGSTKIATVTTTSYVNTGLTNGTSYTYKVVAYRLNSPASPFSSTASATPVAPPLATPAGLAATPGDAQVQLTWGTVSGATSYVVYRNGTQLTTVTTPSYLDTTVTNGTSYSYYVVARSSTSTSAASATATATPQAAATGAPTGLSATAGDGIVSLSWNVVSGATGYNVYRNGTLLQGGLSGNSLTDSTVTNGTTYSYYVTALNGGTESAASATVTATPFVLTPAQPTGLTATAGNAQVALSWSASANATGYRVYRGSTLVSTQAGTTFTDTGLTNGTAYSYYVVATNGAALSPASSTVTATPMAPAPPAPTGVAATAGNAQVVLTWNAVTPATGYRVYRGGVLVGSPTAATFTDTGLTNGATYTYYVTAVNQTTEGPASASVTGTPAKPPVNGTFTGAIGTIASGHGTIRVVIVVTNSVITSSKGTLVTSDGQSETVKINNTALPQYDTKTVAANSASITKVSGATLSWSAYKTSLQSAITQAGL